MNASDEVYKTELLRELEKVSHKKEKYCKIVTDTEQDLEHYLYLIEKCEVKIEKYTLKILAKLEDIKKIQQLLDGVDEGLKGAEGLKPST
jgi:hypothetical protein